jgi:hypothetical protein
MTSGLCDAMTTREFTMAFEIAIGLFALYLFARRFARMMRDDNARRESETRQQDEQKRDPADDDGPNVGSQ